MIFSLDTGTENSFVSTSSSDDLPNAVECNYQLWYEIQGQRWLHRLQGIPHRNQSQRKLLFIFMELFIIYFKQIVCNNMWKNNMNSVNAYARFPFVEVLAIGNLNQFPQGGPLLSGNTGRIIIPRLWFWWKEEKKNISTQTV